MGSLQTGLCGEMGVKQMRALNQSYSPGTDSAQRRVERGVGQTHTGFNFETNLGDFFFLRETKVCGWFVSNWETGNPKFLCHGAPGDPRNVKNTAEQGVHFGP